MSIKFKIEKLDKRHKGFTKFSHRIKVEGPHVEVIPKFMEVREWCWTSWNPSCERDMFMVMAASKFENVPLPQHWAWYYDHDFYECYIYLVSEEDLSMFILKWK
jgi:hypothetical protein